MKLGAGKMHFVLVDAMNIASNMQNDAQKYLAHESAFNDYTIAVGILLNNLPIRLTASMFIKLQKPPFPTKIFGSEEAALKWFDSKREG